jgi:hypothetical protein
MEETPMSRERSQEVTRQPDIHERESRQERAHERAPDDPGRGQGDVLDDQVRQHPESEPPQSNRR